MCGVIDDVIDDGDVTERGVEVVGSQVRGVDAV